MKCVWQCRCDRELWYRNLCSTAEQPHRRTCTENIFVTKRIINCKSSVGRKCAVVNYYCWNETAVKSYGEILLAITWSSISGAGSCGNWGRAFQSLLHQWQWQQILWNKKEVSVISSASVFLQTALITPTVFVLKSSVINYQFPPSYHLQHEPLYLFLCIYFHRDACCAPCKAS